MPFKEKIAVPFSDLAVGGANTMAAAGAATLHVGLRAGTLWSGALISADMPQSARRGF